MIKYETLRDEKHALEKSIEIWEELANSPDGTGKKNIIETGYKHDCPLCQLYYHAGACKDGDVKCVLSKCWYGDTPYDNWCKDQTAANAQSVLNQLKKAYEERYGTD